MTEKATKSTFPLYILIRNDALNSIINVTVIRSLISLSNFFLVVLQQERRVSFFLQLNDKIWFFYIFHHICSHLNLLSVLFSDLRTSHTKSSLACIQFWNTIYKGYRQIGKESHWTWSPAILEKVEKNGDFNLGKTMRKPWPREAAFAFLKRCYVHEWLRVFSMAPPAIFWWHILKLPPRVSFPVLQVHTLVRTLSLSVWETGFKWCL